MLAPMLLRRILANLSLALCLAAGPAGPARAQLQFPFPFLFQSGPPPQAPPRPQLQAPPRPRMQAPPRPRINAPPEAHAQPNAPPLAVSSAYDPDLRRLAEILGSLHFLRGICGANEGQKWRNEAQALINAEAPTGRRHDQMVQSFNRGYRGFQQSYRTCTPAANLAIRRYLQEGAKIAREITARYAN
jgi:uncharacterized protein (TIGR02301 family)